MNRLLEFEARYKRNKGNPALREIMRNAFSSTYKRLQQDIPTNLAIPWLSLHPNVQYEFCVLVLMNEADSKGYTEEDSIYEEAEE